MLIETVHVEDDLVQFRTNRRGWPSSCNVYLVRDRQQSVLVDAGLGVDPDLHELYEAVVATLHGWAQSPGDLHTILLTHTHSDHAGGAIPLARKTGARVLLPCLGWSQASDRGWQVHHIFPDEVAQEVTLPPEFDVAEHFRRETMPDLFIPGVDVSWGLTTEGDEVRIGRFHLKAFHTPGHDVGHLVWVDLDSGVAFTGDMLAARGTSLPWYPPNAGGVATYIASLERLAQLPIALVCPGHHKVHRGAEVARALVRETVGIVHDRDRRILGALRQGPTGFDRLDALVYDAVVHAVIPWASSVTMAHLRHFDERGILYRRPDGMYIINDAAASQYLDDLDRYAHDR